MSGFKNNEIKTWNSCLLDIIDNDLRTILHTHNDMAYGMMRVQMRVGMRVQMSSGEYRIFRFGRGGGQK